MPENIRFARILERRAARLGVPIDDVIKNQSDTESRFLLAAGRRAQELGISVEEVIEKDFERMRSSSYPQPDCLLPYEIEEFNQTGALPADRIAHLSECSTCASLVSATPSERQLAEIEAAVANGRGGAVPTAFMHAAQPHFNEGLKGVGLETLRAFCVSPLAPEDTIEDYAELLRRLVASDDRARIEEELGGRLLSALEADPLNRRHPDTALSEREAGRTYGLLMLCAGLRRQKPLYDRLYGLFSRRINLGWYKGVDVRAGLREALTVQQCDTRLGPVWNSMLRGEPHEYLPGGPGEGFRGVLMLSTLTSATHRQYMDLLGDALGAMTRHLASAQDRRRTFQGLLDQARLLSKLPPQRDEELIYTAHRHAWPDWAVQCLPLFSCRQSQESPQVSYAAVLWRPLAYVARIYSPDAQFERLCGGEVYLAKVNSQAAILLQEIAPLLERARLEWEFPSARSCNANAADYLGNLALDLSRIDDNAGRTFCKARQQLLAEAGVGISAAAGA
jgi:hypothetical protein